MRVGIGYDSHPFAKGRKLILGGVEIPHAKGLAGHSDADAIAHALTDALLGAAGLGDIGVGLAGHSDADAIAHALTDALLGAAGLGDIGRMFPNDDPQWKDARSLDLLNKEIGRAHV